MMRIGFENYGNTGDEYYGVIKIFQGELVYYCINFITSLGLITNEIIDNNKQIQNLNEYTVRSMINPNNAPWRSLST